MFIQDKRIVDKKGAEVKVSAFGSMATSTPSPKIAVTFENPLDDENVVDIDTTGNGTAVAQHNGNLLKVQTNGTGTAKVNSQNVLEYTAGAAGEAYFTVSYHGVMTENTTALIGLHDDNNGVTLLGYRGTDFTVSYRNDNYPGNDTIVTSGNFNGDFDIADYLANKRQFLHRIEITYGYLGVGDISILIKPNIPSRKWKILHTFHTDGALEERTHTGRPILPITAEVSATNGEDIYMCSGSWSAKTYAIDEDIKAKKTFHRTVVGSLETGTILGIKNIETFAGKPNKIRTEIEYLAFGTDSEGLYDLVVIKNPTTIAGGTGWTPKDETKKVTHIREGITGYTGGEEIFAFPVAAGSLGTNASATPLDISELQKELKPGDELLFVKEEIGAGGGADNNTLSVLIKERF